MVVLMFPQVVPVLVTVGRAPRADLRTVSSATAAAVRATAVKGVSANFRWDVVIDRGRHDHTQRDVWQVHRLYVKFGYNLAWSVASVLSCTSFGFSKSQRFVITDCYIYIYS